MFEKGLDGIASQVWIYRDRVRAITLESLVRVLLSGAADVAALAVENDDGSPGSAS